MSSSRSTMPAAGVTAAALLLVLAAAPAAADWLVLNDGGRVETRGPWKVDGKLVVFTTTDGQLASLRLANVDPAASREATAAAARPRPAATPPPAPPQRQAVMTLTDADVRRELRPGRDRANGVAAEPEGGGAADTEGAAAPPGEPQSPTGGLVVTDWQEEPLSDGEGLRLTGTLRNRGSNAATNARLTAVLFDSEGSLLATGEARLSAANVMPGRQVRFSIDFLGVFAMSAVRFETASLDFRAGEPADAAPAEQDSAPPQGGEPEDVGAQFGEPPGGSQSR